ncbi:MAG: cation-translocating P-type ATPase [Coriobacteriales bacterium]|nr:cation-translocating P-type ATPase [Coriobacteriales bacterium]
MASILKKLNDIFAGLPATLIAGVFLLASLLLLLAGVAWAEQLAWVPVLVCGLPLLYLAIWRIIHNPGISKISSALLICMAMFAALFIGELFAAGEVAFIMALGAILEDMTTKRARKGLHQLIALAPKTAHMLRDGAVTDVPVGEIRVGDVLRVLPGETMPVDGDVIAGESSVDQSVMTGESLPVDVAAGDAVFSGTVNRFGSVDMLATKVGEDSSLSQLIRLVQEADRKQAPVARIADRWASWLVPVALLVALITWLVTGETVRGVTVLVVFCPCALVLATPTAIMAAVGQATKHGVIIKSGEALERMGKVDTVAFDKTGTLTRGELAVSDIVTLGSLPADALLATAASVEVRSEHPLARAIVARAKAEGIEPGDVDDFQMTAGRGVQATLDGESWLLGNERFLADKRLELGEDARVTLDGLRDQGKASVIVARDGGVEGIIALADVVRPEAAEMVTQLAALGVHTVLLTGDNERAARTIAATVGIDDVRADLLPAQKVDCVSQLMETNSVCMVGDGVNDAPALKTADVGVAMGVMGSDIAVEAADVALMTDDLSRLPYLKWLSNACVRTIRGAITLSMCINFVAVGLSVLGLMGPVVGALVHNCGSCFVVLLAALLYDRKYPGFEAKTQQGE